MAELADAQASGACGSNIVRVQVPLPALFFYFPIYSFVDSISTIRFSSNMIRIDNNINHLFLPLLPDVSPLPVLCRR